MSEKREKLSKNSSPIVQKLGELKQKINGEKLKLLGLVNAGVSHSDKNTGVVLSHSSKSVRRKKTKVSKRPSQLKTSTSSIVVHHPNHNSSSKEHRKFRIVCEDTKYTKNGSPTSDIKAESTSNTTTDTLKSAEEISASSKDTAATSISLVRSCQICSLSFTSDILFRKHCAEHLLVQAPCSSTDSLNVTSASNLPVCGAHLINEPSIVPYQETSVLLPESLSASPFPAVPISCSSLPDIKSPILDEGTPRDLSLSVLLPVLPEGLPIAPLMTTPSELRQLLAAELDDRVCDWRSKNIQNLPDNRNSSEIHSKILEKFKHNRDERIAPIFKKYISETLQASSSNDNETNRNSTPRRTDAKREKSKAVRNIDWDTLDLPDERRKHIRNRSEQDSIELGTRSNSRRRRSRSADGDIGQQFKRIRNTNENDGETNRTNSIETSDATNNNTNIDIVSYSTNATNEPINTSIQTKDTNNRSFELPEVELVTPIVDNTTEPANTSIGDIVEPEFQSDREPPILYSFIAYNYTENSRTTNNRPNYVYFNHGDHLHILFCSTPTNKKRSIERISADLGINPGGIDLCFATNIRVESYKRFILYLHRKGLKSWTIINNGLQALSDVWKYIQQLLKVNKDYRSQDAIDGVENCIQYIAAKREERKQDSYKKNSYARIEEIIGPIIDEHQCETLSELRNILTTNQIISFFKMWGNRWESLSESLISYKKQGRQQLLQDMNYFDIIALNTETPKVINKAWILSVFYTNNINFEDFIAKFIIVREKKLTKINTFTLFGESNCGKSMIIKLLTERLNPTILGKQEDASSFYFQRLLKAGIAILEEPTFTQQNINTYKCLLGGETYVTDVKNHEHQTIPRVPFILTSNEDNIASRCSSVDQDALENRMFKFTKKINNGLNKRQHTTSARHHSPSGPLLGE
ncbi:Parvovirus non-structural protein 1 helicase domain [Trinorchestia longiramus]|nr:Parvovirus non-structural protein 1 helicase domain [Trinorchestia longiramus]